MKTTKQKLIARAVGFVVGASVIAVAAPAVTLSISMENAAQEAQQRQENFTKVESMVTGDSKFEEISGRLFLENDKFKPTLQASSLEKKFSKEASLFPYQMLPAYQSMMDEAQKVDRAAQRRYDDKIDAKAAALANAKGVCDLVQKDSIVEVGAAARNGETNLWQPIVRANLPVYLEYCGASDEYKAAIMNATRYAKSPKDYKEKPLDINKEYQA